LPGRCIGGMFSALGGMILAFAAQAVVPDRYLPRTTFFLWAAMILGGAASVKGAIAGAMAFWFVVSAADGLLRPGVSTGFIPEWLLTSQPVAAVRFIIVRIMPGALMTWRPQAIVGMHADVTLGARWRPAPPHRR